MAPLCAVIELNTRNPLEYGIQKRIFRIFLFQGKFVVLVVNLLLDGLELRA